MPSLRGLSETHSIALRDKLLLTYPLNSAAGKTLRRQLRLLSDAKPATMTSQAFSTSKL